MLAALDETTPEDSKGIYYVIVATVVPSKREDARSALSEVVNEPGRRRPFHWHLEGSTTRSRMIECLGELGVIAHACVHYPTGRRKQEEARARGLAELIPLLVAEGVDELLIESRGELLVDSRDKRAIVHALRGIGKPEAFSYGWYNKDEALLWSADAVCGAVREYLLRENGAYYQELCRLGIMTEPIFIC